MVSLKISKITAERAPIAARKVVISLPVIMEKIFKIATNQTKIKIT